jgi:hypothetical protein
MRIIERLLFSVVLALALAACAGSSIQMTQIHLEEARSDKPIKDVLVIVIIDDQEIRAIFEKHFVDWLNAKGVEAITSVAVLPIQKGVKLKKEAIVEVVDAYENDAILLTHLLGYEESEVFSRDRPQFFYNYYGFYNYAWGYVYWPTIYGEKVQFSLETGLYDVKTESLLWAGESLVKNPETTGQAIGQVVVAVMKELDKHAFLPTKR